MEENMKKKNVKKQFFLVLIFVIIILIISSLLFPKQKKINNVSYSINFTKSNLGTKLEAYIKDSSYEADILKADGNKTIYGVINDTLENGNLFLTKGLFLYDIESEELKYYEFNEYSRVIDFIIFDNKIYQVILENDTEDSSIKWKIQVQELNNSISWIVKEGTLIDVFKYPRLFFEDDNLYITTLTNFEKNSEGYAKEKYSLSKIENNVLKELISYEGSLIKEEGILAYNIMNVKIENSIFYHTIVDENSIQRLMAYNIKNKENKEIKSNDSKNLILYSYIPIKNSMYIQYAYKNQTNRAKFEFD